MRDGESRGEAREREGGGSCAIACSFVCVLLGRCGRHMEVLWTLV